MRFNIKVNICLILFIFWYILIKLKVFLDFLNKIIIFKLYFIFLWIFMILEEIRDFLISNKLNLSKKFTDWRINASINEDEVLKIIQTKFNINIPKARNWFDFSIEENWVFYPVNIKITDTTHADNLSCKLWIYYALTWIVPSFQNEISWEKYFNELKKNIKDNNEDYYFLIINKKNNKDIFLTSLKTLQTLQPNWNNLPFQCKWDINRKPEKRNFKDAEKFILKTFWESIKQRANIYFTFKELFKEYV